MPIWDQFKKALDDTAKVVQKQAQNLAENAGTAVQGLAETAGNAVGQGVDAAKKALNIPTGKEEFQPDPDIYDFIQLLYYVITVDGEITEAEDKKFTELATELDENYPVYKESLINGCLSQIELNNSEYGHQIAVKLGVQAILLKKERSFREKKMIFWDMLSLAYIDSFSTEEQDLIRFVREKLSLPKTLLEEMQNYCSAIKEINDEKELLRSSPRPYNEIEPLVNELTDRQVAMTDAITELLKDEDKEEQ